MEGVSSSRYVTWHTWKVLGIDGSWSVTLHKMVAVYVKKFHTLWTLLWIPARHISRVFIAVPANVTWLHTINMFCKKQRNRSLCGPSRRPWQSSEIDQHKISRWKGVYCICSRFWNPEFIPEPPTAKQVRSTWIVLIPENGTTCNGDVAEIQEITRSRGYRDLQIVMEGDVTIFQETKNVLSYARILRARDSLTGAI